MNLFKQVFELFRAVDTLHTCLRTVFTKKKKWFVTKKNGE
jgi:hypothetical protein